MKNTSLYILIISIYFSSVALLGCQSSNKEADRVYQEASANFITYRDSTAYYLSLYRTLPRRMLMQEWSLQANDCYSRMQFDSAATYYGMASTIAKSPNDRFDFLLRAANTSEINHHYEQADSLLTEAHSVLTQMRKKGISQARLLGTRGVIATRRGHYKEATQLLTKAVDQLAQDSLHESYVFYLNYLGIVHYKQGHYGRATTFFIRSYNLAQRVHLNYLIPRQYQYVIRLYIKINRFNEASSWLKKYHKWANEHHVPLEKWRVEDASGILYTEKGDYETALQHFKRAKCIIDSIGRRNTQAVAVSNLGNLYRRMKRYEEAMACFQQAYLYYTCVPVSYNGMVKTLWKQADMAGVMREDDRAESLLKRSLQYTDSISDLSLKIQSLRRLAVYYGNQREYKRSNALWGAYTRETEKWNQQQKKDNLQKLLVQYEAKRKAVQILNLRHSLSLKNWTVGFLLLMLCTLLILLYFVWLLHRKQLIYNRELVRQQEEIEKKTDKISSQIKTCGSSDLSDTKAQISKRLVELMENGIYRNPELSLKCLAQVLGTNTSYLSEIINKEFDCNYKYYIASARITWCKHQLANNPHYVVKQLAIDAGFTSASTFYNSFKMYTKMTPKEYINAVANQRALSTDNDADNDRTTLS